VLPIQRKIFRLIFREICWQHFLINTHALSAPAKDETVSKKFAADYADLGKIREIRVICGSSFYLSLVPYAK